MATSHELFQLSKEELQAAYYEDFKRQLKSYIGEIENKKARLATLEDDLGKLLEKGPSRVSQ